jgi:hypothetical protein
MFHLRCTAWGLFGQDRRWAALHSNQGIQWYTRELEDGSGRTVDPSARGLLNITSMFFARDLTRDHYAVPECLRRQFLHLSCS